MNRTRTVTWHSWRGASISLGLYLCLLCLSLLPAAASDSEQGGLAVEGLDRARLLPPAGAEVSNYQNVGYQLRRDGDEVSVEVLVAPLSSISRFEPPVVEVDDALARLARAITLGSRTDYDAVSKVLGWVARNIEYELDRSLSQEADAVLDRRSGYCTGVARLSVALLRAAGIEAREVAGYVFGNAPGAPQGYHRWIESYLPDVGWVFSDPLRSHHYVPASYLRLAGEWVDLASGKDGLLMERRNSVSAVDVYSAATAGIRARRNSDRRVAAALVVRTEDQASGLAVLEGNQTRWTHSLVDGETSFVGLEPGTYQLEVMLSGRGILQRRVMLSGREHATLLFSAPETVPTMDTTSPVERPAISTTTRSPE